MPRLQIVTEASDPDEAIGPLPLGQVPNTLGAALSDDLRAELHGLLWDADGQLGSVYQARVAHPEAVTPTQLHPYTTCAVVGAVSNRLAAVNAIFNLRVPAGPSVARQIASPVSAPGRGRPGRRRTRFCCGSTAGGHG